MKSPFAKKFVSLIGMAAMFAACELDEPEKEPTSEEKIWELEPGVFRVDATSEEEWIFFDLDSTSQATENEGWELAFQRTLIAANSDANVMVARLDGVELDEVEAAPESGYWLDGERPSGGGGRGAGGDGLAFHNGDDWWGYDFDNHIVFPKPERVYVVLSDEGRAFALQITDYYDDAGTSGMLTLRLKEITPPVDPEEPGRPGEPEEPEEPEPGSYEEVTIDATDGEGWAYFDLDTGKETDADGGWDIAFQHWTIATNGPGGVAVAVVDGHSFAEITQPPAQEYLVDEIGAGREDLAFHGESPWYVYDRESHEVAPREERIYVLQSTEGAFFVIEILKYETVDPRNPAGFTTFRYKEIE